MKVLLINGSPRKNGNTFVALSEAAKTLEKHGLEAEIVHIGVKPVRGCIACGQCAMKQLERCVFDDDICNRITEKLKEYDKNPKAKLGDEFFQTLEWSGFDDEGARKEFLKCPNVQELTDMLQGVLGE